MAVLDFAAHSLDYQEVTPGHVDDATGDYVKGTSAWVEDYCKCREFKYGDRIRIKFFRNPDDVREFKVLGFHRYQKQCKMWV